MQVRMICEGTAPYIQHNPRLADPLEPVVGEIKKLTSKRIKTEDDHQRIADLEWEGGLYWQEGLGPYVPSHQMMACLTEAARMTKAGKKIQRAVAPVDPLGFPLIYAGSREVAVLRPDPNFRLRASVRVVNARTMRTRPCFREWKIDFILLVDEAQLDFEELDEIAYRAGAMAGIGEWRPTYGRFQATLKQV